jgi:hypothetical protein
MRLQGLCLLCVKAGRDRCMMLLQGWVLVFVSAQHSRERRLHVSCMSVGTMECLPSKAFALSQGCWGRVRRARWLSFLLLLGVHRCGVQGLLGPLVCPGSVAFVLGCALRKGFSLHACAAPPTGLPCVRDVCVLQGCSGSSSSTANRTSSSCHQGTDQGTSELWCQRQQCQQASTSCMCGVVWAVHVDVWCQLFFQLRCTVQGTFCVYSSQAVSTQHMCAFPKRICRHTACTTTSAMQLGQSGQQ